MYLLKVLLLSVMLFMSVKVGFADDTGVENFSPTTFAVVNKSALTQYFEEREISQLSRNLAEDNILYQQILDEFNRTYREVGDRQIRAINNGKNLYVWGGMNHVGISYTKSFLDFSVELNRTVAPDLFDDKRYIVTDYFHIYIDASKVLHNLRELDVIDITEAQFAAYAGVTFKRSYKHVHFADSYEQGLGFDLEKLFFTFMNFRSRAWLDLAPYEFITKEDSMSVRAGGVATIPIYQNISGSIGVMAKYHRLARVDIQAVGADDRADPDERFRISYTKEKGFETKVSASIQADFLALLRITLLSFDFSYEYKDSYRINLSFKDHELPHLRENTALAREVGNVMRKGKGDMDVLAPHIVTQERRREQTMKSKYALLILGVERDSKTSHIQITKDDKVYTFFRHNFSRIKYQQNIFSRLFAIVLKSFLKLDSVVNKHVSDTKTLTMEYDSEKNLIQSKEDLIVEEEKEKLTLNFKQQFYAWRTHGWINRLNKKFALKILNNYSGIDPLITDNVESDVIRGPMYVRTNFVMNKAAIDHFNGLTLNQVYDYIDEACHVHKGKGIFKFFRNLFNFCKHSLQNSYDRYFKELTTDDYTQNTYNSCKKQLRKKKWFWFNKRKWRVAMNICMQRISQKNSEQMQKEIPLWRLKTFLQRTHVHSEHKQDMYNLFGLNNVFFHGSLEAKTADGQNVQTYFKEGNFSGTGLVNNFLKNNKMRSPAAIVVE